MTRPDLMTCEEAFAHLEDYVDRELAPDEHDQVARHLAVCEVCTEEFDFEARVIEEVRAKLGRVVAPESLRERVARVIAEERQGSGGTVS